MTKQIIKVDKSASIAMERKPGGMESMNFKEFADEFWASFVLAGVLMSAVVYRMLM